MRVTINGKRWTVRWVRNLRSEGQPAHGSCDCPELTNKEIRLNSNLKRRDRELLDTAIHEGLHAGVWQLSEEAVEIIAGDLARMLWQLGFRRG